MGQRMTTRRFRTIQVRSRTMTGRSASVENAGSCGHFGRKRTMRRRELLTLIGGLAASAPVCWACRPRAARAQQPRMPVVGLLHPATPEGYAHIVAALRQGLSDTGHVEGRNLAIEFRWGEDHIERLPELAAD